MAEYVTYEELRAEITELRADIAGLGARLDTAVAQLRADSAEREARLERSLTRAATIAALLGGGIAALPAYIAVSVALVRLFGGHTP
jgi:hypothetical protein